MPRNYISFVVQTPDPDGLFDRVEDLLGDEYYYERAEPRQDEANRIRIEGTKWFRSELASAIESGELGEIDWAIVMVTMDEAIGEIAWIYDGDEHIDTFEGDEHLSGLDTEAYVERFHGIVVDRSGPYITTQPFDPSRTLAQERPDETLADEPPEPPFEITGDDHWTLVVAETDMPESFWRFLESEAIESEVVLDPETPTIDRSWVTDGQTQVTLEQRGDLPPNRIRARIPMAAPCVADLGIHLPFGPMDFDGDFDWVLLLHGVEGDERVRAWLFVKSRRVRRFSYDDALDNVDGEEGLRGADVAEYFDHYYGIDVDPTPEGIPSGDRQDVDLGDREPPEHYAEVLDEHGIEFPKPETE